MNVLSGRNYVSTIARRALALTAAYALLVSGASAAVIFNNGTPQFAPIPAQGAPFADGSNTIFSAAADNFSLGAGANTILDIHWWGIYGNGGLPNTDNFSINIYNNNAGFPGTLAAAVNILSLTRVAPGGTITGQTLYRYDAVVSPITLAASTTYWLGISNTTGGFNWAWVQSANSGGNAKQYSSSTGLWNNTAGKELAFNLTNDIVPEPSSIVLAITGVVGLLGLAFRRRARK